MARHIQLGAKGEQLARSFLIRKGYEILDINWCYQKAEVDLIASFDSKIIFIEVKTRSSVNFGQPEEFVDESKQRNLRRAADQYIYLMNFDGEIRFDIISVLVDQKDGYQIHHIEDAFW